MLSFLIPKDKEMKGGKSNKAFLKAACFEASYQHSPSETIGQSVSIQYN